MEDNEWSETLAPYVFIHLICTFFFTALLQTNFIKLSPLSYTIKYSWYVYLNTYF